MSEHLEAKIGQYLLIKNQEEKVLVLERSRSKSWCLPGGRLGKGEDWKESLKRELKEELGVECSDFKPVDVNILEDPYQIKYCVYFEPIVDISENIALSEEHSGLKWIASDDIDSIGIEDDKVAKVIRNYLSKYYGKI